MRWKRADELTPNEFKVSVVWDPEGIVDDNLEERSTFIGSNYAKQTRRLQETIK